MVPGRHVPFSHIVKGWEIRTSDLVTAAKSKVNHITADEIIKASEVAANFILSDISLAHRGNPPRIYYAQILDELAVHPAAPFFFFFFHGNWTLRKMGGLDF